MSEPEDELTPLTDDQLDGEKLSRSPYIALGVAALVVSTVFAAVATLASSRDEAAPSPRSKDAFQTSTSESYTTDPTTTSSAAGSSKASSSSGGAPTTTVTTTTTTTTSEGETTTTPGHTTTRPTTTTTTRPANKPPVADFTFSCTNLDCAFDGHAAKDPDGNITTFAWSFGGGGITTNHHFDTAGTYNVKLTVTDNQGKTATRTKQVTVTAPTTTSSN